MRHVEYAVLQERRSEIELDDQLRVYDPAVARLSVLATSRRLVLTVVGAVVAGIGVQLLLPLGHKPIKDLALGVVLLALGTPLMVFSVATLRRGRRSRERSWVDEVLRRRSQS